MSAPTAVAEEEETPPAEEASRANAAQLKHAPVMADGPCAAIDQAPPSSSPLAHGGIESGDRRGDSRTVSRETSVDTTTTLSPSVESNDSTDCSLSYSSSPSSSPASSQAGGSDGGSRSWASPYAVAGSVSVTSPAASSMATLPPSRRLAPSPAGVWPPTSSSPLTHQAAAAAAAVAPSSARAVHEATRRLQEAFAQVSPGVEMPEMEEEQCSGELTFRGDGAAKRANIIVGLNTNPIYNRNSHDVSPDASLPTSPIASSAAAAPPATDAYTQSEAPAEVQEHMHRLFARHVRGLMTATRPDTSLALTTTTTSPPGSVTGGASMLSPDGAPHWLNKIQSMVHGLRSSLRQYDGAMPSTSLPGASGHLRYSIVIMHHLPCIRISIITAASSIHDGRSRFLDSFA
jgi:hypothetical protein